MSCVVGVSRKGQVIIVADSYGCQDNRVHSREDRKIFTVNGRMIIGFAGQWRAGQVIEQGIILPRPRKSLTDFQYIVRYIVPQIRRLYRAHRVYDDEAKRTPPDVSFLAGYAGGLYKIESDGNVSQSNNGYDAIGAGEEYALGSLYTSRYIRDDLKRIGLALGSAQHHCPWVGPPFTGFSLTADGISQVAV